MPIAIPKGVEVRADRETVRVKGPKGDLASHIPAGLTVVVEKDEVRISGSTRRPGS
jgi:ribosomal protein L6P/L9E